MIYYNDPHGMLPELAETYSDFVCDAELAQFDVLCTHREEAFVQSDRFTVFVDTEPRPHSSAQDYQQHRACRPNSVWAISAWSPTQDWAVPTVKYLSNMAYVARLNRNMPLVSTGNKLWTATALWGGWMRSRHVMLQALIDKSLDHRCLITLMKRPDQFDQTIKNYQTAAIPELDIKEFNQLAYQNGISTMKSLTNRPGDGWVSQLIPWKIYNSAMVSIVAETENLPLPDTFYISEKLSRVIWVAHPFWVYGCPGFLAQLKELGFKTYANWWDESYDSIIDSTQRARAIIDSFSEFANYSQQKQLDIVYQCRPVAEHNADLMRNTAWMTRDLCLMLREKFGQGFK